MVHQHADPQLQAMDSHKALEEQLDGLATFVEGELASTRVEKVKNRKNSIAGVEMMLKSRQAMGKRNSIIGVENMLQSIEEVLVARPREAATPARSSSNEEIAIPAAIAKMEERFSKLEKSLGRLLDSPPDSTKTRRNLFPQSRASHFATAATQTDETLFSSHLHTAEIVESLSHSICTRITEYLEERIFTGAFGASRTSLEERGVGSHPSSSGSSIGTMPDLRSLSSPVSDPIFADEIAIPAFGSGSSARHANLRRVERQTPREKKREELSRMMMSPINPPFTKSPKSKGLRQSGVGRPRKSL